MRTFLHLSEKPVWMNTRIILTAGSALCILLLVAGCTQTADTHPASALPGQTTGQPALETLILTPADIPMNVTLSESRKKTRGEVSSVAENLGWQNAYVVRYHTSGPANANVSGIIQTITVYPSQNIPDIIAIAMKQEQSQSGMTFTALPSPATISGAHVFKATKNPVNVTEETTTSASPFIHSSEDVSGRAGYDQDYVEILFFKGDIFEVIHVSGTMPDEKVLYRMAQAAYDKLP